MQINNHKKHNFIKIICGPATCFDLLGVIFRLVFEKYQEVYRLWKKGKSRFLQVFIASLVFTYYLISRLKLKLKITSLKLN
jgi:hypothetical protein